jgi:hypothetical protein
MCLLLICGIIVITLISANILWMKRKSHGGQIIITQDASGKKLFSLELDKAPIEIEQMKRITFKVVPSEEFTI